jgi:hypothetical protein
MVNRVPDDLEEEGFLFILIFGIFLLKKIAV